MSGLNSDVNWFGLLGVLGCPVPLLQLPAATFCPLCPKGRLRVYRDSFLGGAWYHCRSCRFAGDSIELAAKKWGCDTEEALARLHLADLLPLSSSDSVAVARYQRVWKGRRKMREIWQSGLTQHPASVDKYLLEMGVLPHQDAAWKAEVQNWLRVVSVPAARRNWPGRGMGAVPTTLDEAGLVVFEDLPGRPVIGRLQANLEAWQPPPTIVRDTSLVMGLSAIPEGDTPVYVCRDISAVLQLQMHSLHDRRRALDIVGLLPATRPSPVWAQLGRPLVFWEPSLTAGTIREAASCSGRILLASVRSLNITKAGNWKSWQHAAADHLRNLAPVAAVQFLRDTKLAVADIQEILAVCDAKTRQGLLPILQTDPEVVTYGVYQVTLDGSSLYATSNTKKPKLISDTCLKVSKVYDGRDQILCGHILFGKHRVPFKTKASKIEAGPELWIRRQLWKKKLSVPFVDRQWKDHLLNLGFLFGNPETVPTMPRMGWCQAEDGLVLATYCLKRGGDVRYFRESSRGLKFGNCSVPVSLSAKAVETLDKLPGRALLFGTAAYVAATLLQKLTGVVPQPLVLVGDSAKYYVPRFAKLLDCPVTALKTSEDFPEVGKRIDTARKHSWPTVVSLRPDVIRSPAWPSLGTQGLLLNMDNHNKTLELLAGSDTWMLSDLQPNLEVLYARDFLADLLPVYLKDLASRDFQLPASPAGPVLSVYEDMRSWWQTNGGSELPEAPPLTPPRAATEPCLRYLLHAVANDIQTLRLGFTVCAHPGALAVETDLKYMYLPVAGFKASLSARRINLNTEVFEDRLQSAGLLSAQDERGRWKLPARLLEPSSASKRSTRTA